MVYSLHHHCHTKLLANTSQPATTSWTACKHSTQQYISLSYGTSFLWITSYCWPIMTNQSTNGDSWLALLVVFLHSIQEDSWWLDWCLCIHLSDKFCLQSNLCGVERARFSSDVPIQPLSNTSQHALLITVSKLITIDILGLDLLLLVTTAAPTLHYLASVCYHHDLGKHSTNPPSWCQSTLELLLKLETDPDLYFHSTTGHPWLVLWTI